MAKSKGQAAVAEADAPPAPRTSGQPRLIRILSALASLRLTVVLFVFAIAVVFMGTLAQVDAGTWTVVSKYFRSASIWVPLQIFFPRSMHVGGGFPFPGGWLIGGLLLTNLLAAHLVRFKISWKRSGILLIHAGLVMLMVSEFVTGLFAVEGNMSLPNGASKNYVEHTRYTELAIISPDPADPKVDDVVVVPGSLLRKGGRIQHAELPFDVQADRYMVNSDLVPPGEAGPGVSNPASAGLGLQEVAVERPEVGGASQTERSDIPSAYVTFQSKKHGRPLGTYLVSLALSKPQAVTVDGKTYEVELRFKRTYKPYTVQLLHFTHKKYLGTETPMDFRSRVRLIDPTQHEERVAEIYMNHPLQHAGETFYQSGFLPDDAGTILQIVRNPGSRLPYISCLMVALGMLIHFGLHLVGFLRRRVAL